MRVSAVCGKATAAAATEPEIEVAAAVEPETEAAVSVVDAAFVQTIHMESSAAVELM